MKTHAKSEEGSLTYDACGASFGPAYHIQTFLRILASCLQHAPLPALHRMMNFI